MSEDGGGSGTTTSGDFVCAESNLPAPFCHRLVSAAPGPTEHWVGYVDQVRDGVRPLILHDDEARRLKLVSPTEPSVLLAEGPEPIAVPQGWKIPITADFNGDGIHDFVVVSEPSAPDWNESLVLLDGATFESLGSLSGTEPRFEAAMDVDADGTEELVSIDVFHNDKLVLSAWRASDGELNLLSDIDLAPGFLPDDVIRGDFNGDGRADIAVTWTGDSEPYWLGEPAQILSIIAPGSGGEALSVVQSPQPLWARSTGCADMDGDGDDDIVIARDSDEIVVFEWSEIGFTKAETLAMAGGYESNVSRIAVGSLVRPGYGGVLTHASVEGGDPLERQMVAVFPSTVDPAFLPMLKLTEHIVTADFDDDGFDDVWDPLVGVYLSDSMQ